MPRKGRVLELKTLLTVKGVTGEVRVSVGTLYRLAWASAQRDGKV
jgi:hypothetical protein